jgi:hypothetical protein
MIFAIAILWLPPAIYGIYETAFIPTKEQSPMLKLSFCLMLVSRKDIVLIVAVLLAAIRLREPYFYFRLKFLVLSVLGKVNPLER